MARFAALAGFLIALATVISLAAIAAQPRSAPPAPGEPQAPGVGLDTTAAPGAAPTAAEARGRSQPPAASAPSVPTSIALAVEERAEVDLNATSPEFFSYAFDLQRIRRRYDGALWRASDLIAAGERGRASALRQAIALAVMPEVARSVARELDALVTPSRAERHEARLRRETIAIANALRAVALAGFAPGNLEVARAKLAEAAERYHSVFDLGTAARGAAGVF